MRTLITVACSFLALPASADVVTVGSVKGWEIQRGDVDCSASAEFESGTSLELGLANSAKWSSLIMWNESWKSIEAGKFYSIKLSFDGGPESVFSGKGMKTDLSGGVFVEFDDLGVLPAFMGAKTVLIWNGDNLIGKFNLGGSSSAIEAVARCAGASRFQKKADPFAN